MKPAPVNYALVNVNDTVQVYDSINASAPYKYALGNITHKSKKFVTVRYNGTTERFSSVTGYQVGYHWPYQTMIIAPDTSK